MPQHRNSDPAAAEQLRAFVARIDRLEDAKAEVASDIKEVYAEAKGNGFDTKALRKVVRLHRKTRREREEEQAIVDLYLDIIEGMGEAARAAANRLAPQTDASLVPLSDPETDEVPF